MLSTNNSCTTCMQKVKPASRSYNKPRVLIDWVLDDCYAGLQAIELLSSAEWTDHLIELQMWVKLSRLALATMDHASITRCTDQALQLTCPNDQKHRSVITLLSTNCEKFRTFVPLRHLPFSSNGSDVCCLAQLTCSMAAELLLVASYRDTIKNLGGQIC